LAGRKVCRPRVSGANDRPDHAELVL